MAIRALRLQWAAIGFLAFALFWTIPAAGQVPGRITVPRTIPSHSEPGESLRVRGVSAQTGHATFASSTGRGILLRVEPGASAEARAASFVDTYGAHFGLAKSSQLRLLRATQTDSLGIEHVRMQQIHRGVPVRGAEFLVHLDGSRVMAANGHVLADLPDDVSPRLPAADAKALARRFMEKHRPSRVTGAAYSEPHLEIFNRSLLSAPGRHRSHLAWFVEATGPALREFIWIDAQTGGILLNFSQFTEAKSRKVYNSAHTYATQLSLVRSEGGPPTGDTDSDNAYTYAGVTYDYYLTNHGRDSFDNAGAEIISNTHYCAEGFPQGTTCPGYQNAGWTGTEMVYADGFASADDVVGHELTHAVTDRSANLFYYMQSGALNESFSDIFGETIDLLDGVGNDAPGVRWYAGEDLPGGAIRNMMNPTLYSDPGKMSDSAYFVCSDSDQGGVHSNSGIPNHAYALMVDGGTYNSTTITGIGLTKAAKVQYRALTVYLTSGSGFIDNYEALNQSCTDLIGTAGITTADCTQVTKALQAVEMNNRWACEAATQAPPLCSTGAPANLFFDSFENVTSTWSATNDYGGWGSHAIGFAASGLYSAYGTDPDDISDHRLSMTSGVVVPAGARLYFDHAFEFESDWYDGGVVEYSINNGASWLDAGGLIDAGQDYNGTIVSGYGNPIGGRAGFVQWSHGYTGTRLNLASLAGQTVRFRFRIGSDVSFGALGWLVDNVTLYTCVNVPTGVVSVVDDVTSLGTVNVASESSTLTGYTGRFLTDVAHTASGALWAIDFDSFYSLNPTTGLPTYVGPLGAGGMNALIGNGNGLLAASSTSTSLYSVNPATGAATPLSGSLGYTSMGDLAFHGGSLYAAVENGPFSDLVRITLSGNSFTAVNLGHVTSDNALFGLAQGFDGHLYGFAGTRVLRINVSNPPASTVVVADYSANFSGLTDASGASTPLAAAFTDHPLLANSSVARAIHILELRARVGSIRAARGLSPYSWTDPTLNAGSTAIRAVHVTDLRTALAQAYAAAALPAPSYTDPSLGALRVKAAHIMELRAAVVAIE